MLRRSNGRIVPDPSRGRVSVRRIVWGHLACIGLDFCRGAVLVALGLVAVGWTTRALPGTWPLSTAWTLAILILGASFPAGAFVRSLGGWRRRGILFAAGAGGFLVGSFLL
jgi:hypothetical protein